MLYRLSAKRDPFPKYWDINETKEEGSIFSTLIVSDDFDWVVERIKAFLQNGFCVVSEDSNSGLFDFEIRGFREFGDKVVEALSTDESEISFKEYGTGLSYWFDYKHQEKILLMYFNTSRLKLEIMITRYAESQIKLDNIYTTGVYQKNE